MTTWDVSTGNGAMIASGGDLIATSDGVNSWCQADELRSTGKKAFKITFPFTNDQGCGISIASASDPDGVSLDSVYLYFNSGFYFLRQNDSWLAFEDGSADPTGSGDVIMFYVDFTAELIYVTVNGNNVLGSNVAAETGGVAFDARSMAWTPHCKALFGGSSFTLDPVPSGLPSGFESWDSAPPTDVTGTLDATDGADSVSMTGTIVGDRTGTMAVTDGADTATAIGLDPDAGSETVWNAADTGGSSWTLSENDTVATADGFFGGIRASSSRGSGKLVFRIATPWIEDTHGFIGISKAGAAFDGETAGSVLAYLSHDLISMRIEGNRTAVTPTATVNGVTDVATFYVDLDGNKLYWDLNGTYEHGTNPETETGGFTIPSGDWFPSVSNVYSGAAFELITYPVGLPSGWSPWDYAGGPGEIAGTLSATDGADIAAVAGNVTTNRTGALAVIDGADTFAGVGNVHVSGTMAATDRPDGLASSGQVTVQGGLAASDGADAVAISGTIGDNRTGTLAAVDGADTAISAGVVVVRGTIAVVDAADGAAMSGFVFLVRSGTLSGTDGADVAAGAGRVNITGSMTGTDGADGLTGSGDTIVTGSLSAVDRPDVAVIVGTLSNSRTGTMAAVEGSDAAIMVARLHVIGVMSGTDGADSLAAIARLLVRGSMAGVDGADTAISSGTITGHTAGTMAAVEGADLFSGAGDVIGSGTFHVTDRADTVSIVGVVPIFGALVASEGADRTNWFGRVGEDVGPRKQPAASLLV